MVRSRIVKLALTATVATLTMLSSGCMYHRHTIGLGPTGLGEKTMRQYYVLFGLIRFNEVDPQRLADNLTSYEIESSYSFVDILLTPLLLPLTATSRTVTVKT